MLEFQDEIVKRIRQDNVEEWLSDYPTDENTRQALVRLYENQMNFMKDTSPCVSNKENLLIEEHEDPSDEKTHYYFQSCYGRKFNDGMSRMLAQYFASENNVNVQVSVSDQGFGIKIPKDKKPDISSAFEKISADEVRDIIRSSLDGTDFLKRYFRINSTRSLMILRNYKGNHKSAKQQQVTSEMMLGYAQDLDNLSVLEETYREIMEDKLNIDKIKKFMSDLESEDMNVLVKSVSTPSPRSFETAALASEDVVMADDESEALKEFQERVLSEIDD